MSANDRLLTVIEKGGSNGSAVMVQESGDGYPIDLSNAETAYVKKMLASDDAAIFKDVLEKAATAGYRRHKAILEDGR